MRKRADWKVVPVKQESGNHTSLIDLYRKRAAEYDASGIHGLEPWREVAVRMLALHPGDRVVDVGCGRTLSARRGRSSALT